MESRPITNAVYVCLVKSAAAATLDTDYQSKPTQNPSNSWSATGHPNPLHVIVRSLRYRSLVTRDVALSSSSSSSRRSILRHLIMTICAAVEWCGWLEAGAWQCCERWYRALVHVRVDPWRRDAAAAAMASCRRVSMCRCHVKMSYPWKIRLKEIITKLICLPLIKISPAQNKSFRIIGSPPQKSLPGRQVAGQNPFRPGGKLFWRRRSYNGAPATFSFTPAVYWTTTHSYSRTARYEILLHHPRCWHTIRFSDACLLLSLRSPE